ncbi:hypothetical protein BV22DRAFT_984542, partial [Leucogyrophana mollusca]
WPSVFTGIQIIVNRSTPAHRDSGSSASMYDLLISLGRGHNATLEINDLQSSLQYAPGAAIALTGRVL